MNLTRCDKCSDEQPRAYDERKDWQYISVNGSGLNQYGSGGTTIHLCGSCSVTLGLITEEDRKKIGLAPAQADEAIKLLEVLKKFIRDEVEEHLND